MIRVATTADDAACTGTQNSRGFTSYNGATDFGGGSQVDWEWVNVSHCGTASATTYPCIRFNQTANQHLFNFDRVILSASGAIFHNSSSPANNTVSITNSKITAPAESNTRWFYETGSNACSGCTRRIEHNVWQGSLFISGVNNGYTITDNVMRNSGNGSQAGCMNFTGGDAVAVMDRNLCYDDNSTADTATWIPGGTITRFTALRNTAATNAYFLQQKGIGVDSVLDGLLAERLGTEPTGVIYTPSAPASSMHSITVRYALVLPNSSNNGNAGTLLQPSFGASDATNTFLLHHNTVCCPNTATGIFRQGGANPGTAGAVPVVENNIAWRPVSGNALVTSGTAALVASFFTAVDYNDIFNLTGTYYAGGAAAYASTPGTHDQTVDPNFVDSTRNFLSWCQAVDPSKNTWPLCIAELMKKNDRSGWNPAFNQADLYNWVRAGFVPRNAALKGAASDGSDIGAMPVGAAARRASVTWR